MSTCLLRCSQALPVDSKEVIQLRCRPCSSLNQGSCFTRFFFYVEPIRNEKHFHTQHSRKVLVDQCFRFQMLSSSQKDAPFFGAFAREKPGAFFFYKQ